MFCLISNHLRSSQIILILLAVSSFSLFTIFINKANASADIPLENKNSLAKFTLVGTIISSQNKPYALLSISGGKIKFYSVGDKVNTYELTAIKHNSVQITKNSQHSIIKLQQNTTATLLEPMTNPQQSLQQSDYTLKRNRLTDIRDNTQKWLNAVTIRLHVSEGRMFGYRIDSINDLQLTQNIGLQKGDIIQAVNGIPVSQPELFAKTINNLLDKSEITLFIERGHKLHKIILNIIE